MHLKMSGSLLLNPLPADTDKYTRAVIHLDNDSRLVFRDPRKFGAMWLVDDRNAVVGNLGPEPLDKGFTPKALARLLENRSAPIKALLCDQSLIAGVGNMYADEALFAAGIHPLKPGGKLTPEEIKRLHHAIREVLKKAIGNKGASIVNYYRPGGETGTAHFEFKVAHRGGEACPVCGTTIQRIPVRNRGSYFCPRCQQG
jgi:formamidopyrimidine-DNA glycosylase